MAPGPVLPYIGRMPDELYDRDILIWSENQADLLRSLARGERVNGIDWEHVVEEIEDVGRSELTTVQNQLAQLMAHLLKIHGWPDCLARGHWRTEVLAFQGNAEQSFSPSMRQRIDLARLWRRVTRQLDGAEIDNLAPRPWPAACPFTLDQLLTESRAALETILADAAGG